MEMKSNSYRKYIYLITILLVGVLYAFSAPFKTFSGRIIFLFTSRSTESIMGYLNSYPHIKPIVAIGLMVLQAVIIPFKYEIMIFANIRVFGFIIGLTLSIIGRIIGAYICFDIGKALLSDKVLSISKINSPTYNENIRDNNIVHILIRLAPLNFESSSYLSGILGINIKKYMGNSLIWIILTTGIYSFNKGYISYRYEQIAIFTRLILAIVILIIYVNSIRKTKQP